MLSLPPAETLALVNQEHAERRRQAAQDALADTARGDRRWSLSWPASLVRVWSAIRVRPEELPSDVVWPTLNDYPYPQPR
jgi:hypothetical protein